MSPDKPGFLEELKRRHVWRVAAAYAIAGWLIVQIATQVFPFFNIPNWGVRLIVILIVIGFPVAVAFAWIYELTPEGIRRTEPADSPAARPASTNRQIGRKLNALIVAVLVLAVALLAWRLIVVRHAEPVKPAQVATTAKARPPASTTNAVATPATHVSAATAITAQAIPTKSVAVLPFENLSTSKANAYFADGIQDLILTKLADIGDLKVIARTSTAMYASHPENLTQIGQQLGVATILEGSVQKAGNQVLINVQLIDATSDAHIWAQDYVRTLDNVFGVEGEVSEQIATALKAKLSASQSAQLAAVPTTNPAAYDLFLRAEYQANQGEVNQDSTFLKAAIPLYRKAIAQDPAFALAYARLSMVESQLARFGGGGESIRELRQQASADAEQALKLAPNLPASQIALGYSDYYGKDDFAAALKAFNAALALRPNDADALEARGLVERRLGRFVAALASLTQASAHNPRSSSIANFTGLACLELGRYAEAEIWSQRALALDPDNNDARDINARAILFSTGDVVRALAALQGDAPQLKRNRVSLLVLQRKYPAAIALLKSVPKNTPDYSRVPGATTVLQLANLYRLAGDAAKARPLYAQALLQARAQLARTQGEGLVFVWYVTAKAELGLGHTAEGLRAIAKARVLGVESGDQAFAPGWMEYNAELYAEAERPDLAVPLLAKALVTPGIDAFYSPLMLWLDPTWDPIRHDPAFQALLKKYAKDKPAVTYGNPPPTSGSGATTH